MYEVVSYEARTRSLEAQVHMYSVTDQPQEEPSYSKHFLVSLISLCVPFRSVWP